MTETVARAVACAVHKPTRPHEWWKERLNVNGRRMIEGQRDCCAGFQSSKSDHDAQIGQRDADAPVGDGVDDGCDRLPPSRAEDACGDALEACDGDRDSSGQRTTRAIANAPAETAHRQRPGSTKRR
jgi:hypothetical protein